MKNTLEIEFQLTGTKIFFCYGAKAKKKLGKNRYKIRDFKLKHYCECTTVRNDDTNYCSEYVLTVCEHENIYAVKALIVHEINHCVTNIMEEFGFKCDEFRSYSLQFLYEEIMVFLDNLLSIDNDKTN